MSSRALMLRTAKEGMQPPPRTHTTGPTPRPNSMVVVTPRPSSVTRPLSSSLPTRDPPKWLGQDSGRASESTPAPTSPRPRPTLHHHPQHQARRSGKRQGKKERQRRRIEREESGLEGMCVHRHHHSASSGSASSSSSSSSLGSSGTWSDLSHHHGHHHDRRRSMSSTGESLGLSEAMVNDPPEMSLIQEDTLSEEDTSSKEDTSLGLEAPR